MEIFECTPYIIAITLLVIAGLKLRVSDKKEQRPAINDLFVDNGRIYKALPQTDICKGCSFSHPEEFCTAKGTILCDGIICKDVTDEVKEECRKAGVSLPEFWEDYEASRRINGPVVIAVFAILIVFVVGIFEIFKHII